jgi:hypothetical protein
MTSGASDYEKPREGIITLLRKHSISTGLLIVFEHFYFLQKYCGYCSHQRPFIRGSFPLCLVFHKKQQAPEDLLFFDDSRNCALTKAEETRG